MSVRVTVIGAGRVGAALHALSPARVDLVDRQRGWAELDREPGQPIIVTVRNDDLPAVLAKIPQQRRVDLVFVQNGMLRPWLAEQGLAEATRGLLFLAVAKRGDPIVPGGSSPFHGPRAAAVVEWLRDCSIPCEELDAESFAELELEKLIWNCAFGLLCEVQETSVGVVVERHAELLRDLVGELLVVGNRIFGLSLELEPLFGRLCAYSRSIADFRAAVREWRWRNGAFVEAAARWSIPTPTHAGLIARLDPPPAP